MAGTAGGGSPIVSSSGAGSRDGTKVASRRLQIRLGFSNRVHMAKMQTKQPFHLNITLDSLGSRPRCGTR